MARVVFSCHDTKANIQTFEYYRQDIEAFESLGHEVVVCNRYRDIPRRFDLMFVWWWTFALYPTLLARLRGKPVIITGVYNFRFPAHLDGRDYHGRPWWQRAVIALATKLASLNLFLNEPEEQEVARHLGLTTARYYPCSVHQDYLRGPGSSRELAVFNLTWSGTGNLIRKGIPVLLDAIRIVKDRGVPIRVYLAGHRGDGTDLILKRIRDLGIREQVTWLGPLSRDRKIDLLRCYEIYAQPSLYEGFGLATAEAMGCGAAVVVCDVGAVRSVVGEAGLYVVPGSAEDLAAAIEQLWFDTNLRRRFQAGALERARSMFTPERKRDRLRRYLAEVGIS